MPSKLEQSHGRLRLLQRTAVILVYGRPGSGKSTLAKELSEQLSGAHLITSNTVRMEHSLSALLSDSDRLTTLKLIHRRVVESLEQTSFIVVDTNCMDSLCRRAYEQLPEDKVALFLLKCEAPDDLIRSRIADKYGVQPFVDESISTDDWLTFVETRMSDLDMKQFNRYAGVGTYNSADASVRATQWRPDLDESAAVSAGLARLCNVRRGGASKPYLACVRSLLGPQQAFIPSVRAVIVDESASKLLLIKRRDDGRWALVSGGIELGETATEAIRREVIEETGLRVVSEQAVSLHTGPLLRKTPLFGDKYQPFSVVFLVSSVTGQLVRETSETANAQYFSIVDLPSSLSDHHRQSIRDALEFNGNVIVR